MAIDKVKLPDNSVEEVRDSRIPGIDSTPTSGSANLVTSGGVAGALNQAMAGLGSAIEDKVDKVTGKGLSTNDYTTAEKDKLAGLPSGSELADDLAAKEDVSNKVTTVTSSGTDTQYPSAKAVYDAIEGKKDPTVIAESGAEIVYRQTHGGVATGFSGAAVKGLKGRTLAWNQMAANPNQWSVNSGTIAINKSEVTYTVTEARGGYSQSAGIYGTIYIVKDHKYLVSCKTQIQYNGSVYYGGDGFINGAGQKAHSAGKWEVYKRIGTAQATNQKENMYFSIFSYSDGRSIAVGDVMKIKDVMLIDLTLMFGAGNEPETVEEFEAMFPLPYYAYNEGELISVAAEGIETVGFNLFDEGIMSGWNYITRNADGWSGALNRFYLHRCFENTFSYTGRVFINMNYSLDEGTGFLTAYYVDGTYNDYRLDSATRATVGYETPAGKVIDYIEFSYTKNGTLTIHSLCVNLSDASRNGQYEPHWSKVLPLGLDAIKVKDSQGNIITVNGLASAGDVRDEIRGGKYIKRVGRVDLGTLNWSSAGNDGVFFTTGINTVVRDASIAANLISSKLEAVGYFDVVVPNKIGAAIDSGNCYVRAAGDTNYNNDPTAFKTAMSGVMLYYELETPVEYDLASPMPSLYAVDDCGTEAKYPADTVTSVSAPITADLQYGIKARDIAAEAEDIFTAIRNLQS